MSIYCRYIKNVRHNKMKNCAKRKFIICVRSTEVWPKYRHLGKGGGYCDVLYILTYTYIRVLPYFLLGGGGGGGFKILGFRYFGGISIIMNMNWGLNIL